MNCNWQNYQKWEQLPKNLAAPRSPNWLSQFFRPGKSSLANTLVREISLFRQIEHLERCTKLEFTQPSKRTLINEFTLTEPIGAVKRSLIEALYGKANN